MELNVHEKPQPIVHVKQSGKLMKMAVKKKKKIVIG